MVLDMDLGILGESNGKEKQTQNLNLIMVWIYFTTQYLVNFYGFFKTIAQTFCFFIFFTFCYQMSFKQILMGWKRNLGALFNQLYNLKIFFELWQQFRPLTFISFLLFVGKCVLNKFDGLKRDTGCTINQNLTTEKQLEDLF